MATLTTCCLNLPPPGPPPRDSNPRLPSSTAKTTQATSWFKTEKWRSQCVLGMACMIIGHEMGDFAIGSNNQSLAAAKDIPLTFVVESRNRWSDKRTCPPWRLNSLETIVPENLPRPSARRRWEAVGHDHPTNAPAVEMALKSISSNCFSM